MKILNILAEILDIDNYNIQAITQCKKLTREQRTYLTREHILDDMYLERIKGEEERA